MNTPRPPYTFKFSRAETQKPVIRLNSTLLPQKRGRKPHVVVEAVMDETDIYAAQQPAVNRVTEVIVHDKPAEPETPRAIPAAVPLPSKAPNNEQYEYEIRRLTMMLERNSQMMEQALGNGLMIGLALGVGGALAGYYLYQMLCGSSEPVKAATQATPKLVRNAVSSSRPAASPALYTYQ